MIYYILTIRDRAANCFDRPSFHLSVGAAVRSFTDEVNRAAQDNMLYKHPEDFDLFVLGEYDDNSAKFVCGEPRQVAVGKDVRVKE